jgi:hypothetical protein
MVQIYLVRMVVISHALHFPNFFSIGFVMVSNHMAGDIRDHFRVRMLGFIFVEKVWTVVTKICRINCLDVQRL